MAAATCGTGTRRVDSLAKPKPIPPGFLEDRRSVYWIDRWPSNSEESNTRFVMTPRLESLAKARLLHSNYIGDRPTSMWPVSQGAKGAGASARLTSLASPRLPVAEYKYDRSAYTTVSQPAKSAAASGRLEHLSQPKPHKMWAISQDTYPEGEFGSPLVSVCPQALHAHTSPRLDTLSAAKTPANGYRGERSVQWPVSNRAMTAQATLRLQQLARPKSGRLRKDDYDPYRVSLAARSARPSPRMDEIALPIPRKVRTKKMG